MSFKMVRGVLRGISETSHRVDEAKHRYWAIANSQDPELNSPQQLGKIYQAAVDFPELTMTRAFVDAPDTMNEICRGFVFSNLVSPITGDRWQVSIYRDYQLEPVALLRRVGSRVGVIISSKGRTSLWRNSFKLIGVADRAVPTTNIMLLKSGMRLLVFDEGQDLSADRLQCLKPRITDLGDNDVPYKVVAGNGTPIKKIPDYLLESAFGMIIPEAPTPK